MAMRTKGPGGGENAGDGNIFWVTMSDLLLGLAIIFMTLFVLAMTGFTQNTVEQKQAQIEASKEMAEQLKEANIDAEVDKMTGDIKISDLELFDVNSYALTPKGKAYLDKLVPIYVRAIFGNEKLNQNVANIIVQGHTDSQGFAGASSVDEQFMRNMELSTRRANAVADYIFKTNYDKQYSESLRKTLVVEGKSFSEPVFVNGQEDLTKSRRVELKLKVKTWDIMDVLGGLSNDGAQSTDNKD